jgi:hypothetical protein
VFIVDTRHCPQKTINIEAMNIEMQQTEELQKGASETSSLSLGFLKEFLLVAKVAIIIGKCPKNGNYS